MDSWNASVAILPFGAAILAAWAAANGDRVALMVTIVAGSFAAQAHLAFAGPVATLWSVVLLKAVRLPGGRRATMAALGVLIACWAPVVYDQLFASGNVGALVRYFSRGHQPIGWRAALGIAARQLSLTAPWLGFPEPSSEVTGLLPSRPMLLLVPVGAFLGSALAAYRRHARDAVALQVVIAIAMAASLGATARISDAALSYQVRFWWVIAMCWWVSILWSCLSCAPASRLKASLSLALCCAVMAVSLTTLTSAESMLPGNDARMLAIAEATIPVTAGHPLVLVRSLDSEAMSLTTGLILQLEKHGIRVNVSTLDERALGDRRLVTSTAGALVILVAAGDSLDRLRRQAEQQMSQPGELRLVTSYGTHPRTLAAVFSYRVAAS